LAADQVQNDAYGEMILTFTPIFSTSGSSISARETSTAC
jgi:hypothetical protein